MSISFIKTDKAPAPIGAYSQAVTHNQILYCSGQLGIDPDSGKLVAGDIAAQTDQIFKNLQAVLTAANTNLTKVIKCSVFITDMSLFAAFNEIYTKWFKDHKPARTTVQVARLPLDGLIEIEALASLD